MADSATRLPAVVLAGGPADPELADKYAIRYTAELPIGGKKMVQRVIDALKASSQVGDICLVGDTECEGVSRIVPPGDSIMENLVAGVKAGAESSGGGCVLVAASDIPLVTTEAVDDLITRCQPLDKDFYYPIISREENEAQFPGMRRTYARLAEGTFTGGNLMVMNAGFLAENADLIREVLGARKSVPRLAKLIGLRVLLRAMIAQTIWPGAIDVATLEKTLGRILHAEVKAVRTPHAEIGADVDKAEHIAFAEAALGLPVSEGEST